MSRSFLQVSYFGIPGSFTHGAAQAYFDIAQYEGAPSFSAVFKSVADGQAKYGVIPIENTLAGSVYGNYDLLDDFKLTVCGEISRRVKQCLLVKPAADNLSIDKLEIVYSHPKALEQCSLFFDKYPSLQSKAVADTASAAKLVAESTDRHIAAIANREAAGIYKLCVLAENIENNSYNYTRFLIITKQPVTNKKANKCSIIVRLPHQSGSLSKTLALFTDAGYNLTKIESRPLQNKPFEYTFYLDFMFDSKSQKLSALLAQLRTATNYLHVLGIYCFEKTKLFSDLDL